MKIFVALPRHAGLTRFFTPALQEKLSALGEVRWHDSSQPLSPTELRAALAGCTACLTGWETPRLDEAVLAQAGDLKLVAHVGGSVASVASETLYDRGVRVCSANRVMARFVAEGILALMLASLRDLPRVDRELHAGAPWPRDPQRPRSLLEQPVGFVGLGTVGRCLLDLLRPFGVNVRVYDPYADPAALEPWPHARLAPLAEVLRESAIVSVHASLTEETVGLLGRNQLAQLRDGALLVNAARGAIIDEPALIFELATGRIHAALDVFAQEPLPLESPLRTLGNALLSPHLAGAPCHASMAAAMVADVGRFAAGAPLEHEILRAQFERMTRHEIARSA